MNEISHGHPTDAKLSRRDLVLLSLAALGVVFGDIGASPLYAMRECFHGPHGGHTLVRTEHILDGHSLQNIDEEVAAVRG